MGMTGITKEDYARMEGVGSGNGRRFYIEGLKGELTLTIEPTAQFCAAMTIAQLRPILTRMFIDTLSKKCPAASQKIRDFILSGRCVFREIKPGEKRPDEDTAVYAREFFK